MLKRDAELFIIFIFYVEYNLDNLFAITLYTQITNKKSNLSSGLSFLIWFGDKDDITKVMTFHSYNVWNSLSAVGT